MTHRHVAFAALALWSTLATGRAQGDAAPPRIDDAWVRTAVARVLPAVERACGRTFRKPPQVGLADAGDVMRSLRDDLEPAVAAFFAGQPRQRIQRAIQLRADVLASSMLGKYGFATREVYLLPHVTSFNLGLVHQKGVPLNTALEFVLVHELVHALQDQELDLRTRSRTHVEVDAAEAFAMLIEGHAVFCSERAAAELGLVAAVGPLRSIYAGQRDAGAVPEADLATRRVRGTGQVWYLRSADYLAREHAAGGSERLWQLLAAAVPSTRAMLLAGATGASAVAAAARPQVFAGIDVSLAGPNWTVGRGGVSDARLLIENLPRGDDLVQLLPELVAGGEWFAVAPTPASWRSLYALRFADAAAAARFVALVVDVVAGDMKNSTTTFTSEPFAVWEGAEGRRLAQGKTRAAALAASAEVVLIRVGDCVLQATFVNAPVDDVVFVALAQHVLTALAAAR